MPTPIPDCRSRISCESFPVCVECRKTDWAQAQVDFQVKEKVLMPMVRVSMEKQARADLAKEV